MSHSIFLFLLDLNRSYLVPALVIVWADWSAVFQVQSSFILSSGTSPWIRTADLLYLVRHRLKEDGRCWDFFLLRHETVCEVTSIRKVQPHDPAVGFHNSRVDSKVSRRTFKRRIQREGWGRRRRQHNIRTWKKNSQALHKTPTQYDTWVWLHVDTPFLRVQTVDLQRPLLTQSL